MFTSGTAGEPKPIRHGARYLAGHCRCRPTWCGAQPGDLSGARPPAAGPSRLATPSSARLVRGADGAAPRRPLRRRPAARAARARGRERALHVPHRYRAIAKQGEPRAAAARCATPRGRGRAAQPGSSLSWSDAVGVSVHDGYGQTETVPLTGMPIGPPVRPGSMGRPLPGFTAWIDEGELVVDPATVPQFFLDGDRGAPLAHGRSGRARTRTATSGSGPHRRRDHLRRLTGSGRSRWSRRWSRTRRWRRPRRWPRPTRRARPVVRAVVVLQPGREPSAELARELQRTNVRGDALQVPCAFLEFTEALPKTPSGKIRRRRLARLAGPHLWLPASSRSIASATWLRSLAAHALRPGTAPASAHDEHGPRRERVPAGRPPRGGVCGPWLCRLSVTKRAPRVSNRDGTARAATPRQGRPRGLVPVGPRGARAAQDGGPPILLCDRLLRLPLVPRDGARVVRGRATAAVHERALRVHQGRPRGAARTSIRSTWRRARR